MTVHNREVLNAVEALLAPLKVWKLQRILGAGGAGYVLDVRHTVLDSRRAMKFIHATLLRSRVMRDRFETEARIAYKLDHPNLVKAHEMGVVGDTPYIVMDLVTGGSLEDHLNTNGKMPPRQAVQVIIATLRGLQAAHDQGVVHRDMKPQNLLFTEMGIPKIIDFGIARVMDATRGHTRAGSTMGTWAYMSPEQLHGEVDLIDHRSDIHAVGVTLYVMLTLGNLGQSAFHEQLREHPERLDGISEVLQSVIRKATAKNREDRFETAASMADELELRIALGEIPADPPDTPKLGSAMAKKALEEAVDAPDPQIPRIGGTLQPAHTRAQKGHEPPVDEDGDMQFAFASEVPLLAQADGTWSSLDEGGGAEDVARALAQSKRRLMRMVASVVIVLLLLAGGGIWYATRAPMPEPVVEVAEVTLEPEPIPDLVLPEPEPEPEVVAEVVVPKAKVTVAPKVTTTPKVVVTPPAPDPEVTVSSKAQVRLILVGDTTVSVTLVGDGGSYALTNGSREVPQGTYRVSVTMPGRDDVQTGSLTVTPGLTTLKCDARFKKCTGLQ